MGEAPEAAGGGAALSGAQLLVPAVDRPLAEVWADLPEQVALDRARAILQCTERLTAARSTAVARRELFVLHAAGSTRGWLRTQAGGESGQLVAARRLAQRPQVQAALGDERVSARAAEQLGAVLGRVPAQESAACATSSPPASTATTTCTTATAPCGCATAGSSTSTAGPPRLPRDRVDGPQLRRRLAGTTCSHSSR